MRSSLVFVFVITQCELILIHNNYGCLSLYLGGYKAANNTRYVLVSEKKTWTDAKEHCENVLNSTLATIVGIDDLYNAVALREVFHPHQDLWIGMNDHGKDGEWTWIDGTSWYVNIIVIISLPKDTFIFYGHF